MKQRILHGAHTVHAPHLARRAGLAELLVRELADGRPAALRTGHARHRAVEGAGEAAGQIGVATTLVLGHVKPAGHSMQAAMPSRGANVSGKQDVDSIAPEPSPSSAECAKRPRVATMGVSTPGGQKAPGGPALSRPGLAVAACNAGLRLGDVPLDSGVRL